MALLKCKMCGGDIALNEEKTFYTCEYCGSSMTLPKVSDEQKAALYNRGNHFRRIGEFDKALAIYENIVREDDTDAEAHWCCVLCRFGIEYVEDPTTYEFLPTCHRVSFDSVLEDVDYLAALEHSDGITKKQYQKEAIKISEVQKGILATSQNEEPYDVFICYKETDDNTKERTRDSVDAQEIYYQLTEEGYRVFFSRISLEDKAGTEYEPYIFAALNSAKVMVVVGSKPEYLNAVWVKNEWSRFIVLMKKDRSKLLLPCYKEMDPYDLPEQLSVLQSYDMAKIGFMQDLIRGIKKVISTNTNPMQEKETPNNAGNANVESYLRRAFLFLEDGEWQKADEYGEKVLDLQPENAQAYLVKLMAEMKVHQKEALATCGKAFIQNSNYLKVLRFGDDKIKEEMAKYSSISTPTDAFKFSENEEGNGYVVEGFSDEDEEYTSIIIPSSFNGKPVTSIGFEAFNGCESLTSVIIPDSVTSIGFEAFNGCESLTSVTIPNSVTSIDSAAFEGCKSLTSVTIPDSVTDIGDWVFRDCKCLTSVTIPDSVTSIGLGVFNGCESLADPKGFVIIRGVLYDNGFEKNDATIPNSVTSIGWEAFSLCENLRNVTIPDSVTSIGEEAFKGCKGLTSVTIPDSVTSIGAKAFEDCKGLTSVIIPNSVTSIGGGAFKGCESLADPKGFVIIRGVLYDYCGFERDVIIPDSVTSIGNGAFIGCKGLTSVTIPDSVTSIGWGAFSLCENLRNVTIPNSVTSIGDQAFQDCKSLASVIIPNSVTSIERGAFRDCKNLTGVYIFSNLTQIDKKAFEGCENLKIESLQNLRQSQQSLLQSQQTLQAEYANLKGIFSGKRRKEIENQLQEIQKQLQDIQKILDLGNQA